MCALRWEQSSSSLSSSSFHSVGRSVDATNFIISNRRRRKKYIYTNDNKHIRARREKFSYCWRFEQLRCSESSFSHSVYQKLSNRFLRSPSVCVSSNIVLNIFFCQRSSNIFFSKELRKKIYYLWNKKNIFFLCGNLNCSCSLFIVSQHRHNYTIYIDFKWFSQSVQKIIKRINNIFQTKTTSVVWKFSVQQRKKRKINHFHLYRCEQF